MLIRVEVARDPGHGDDEGEDGEADYEKDFVAHDVQQVFFGAEREGESRESWGEGRSGMGFVYLLTNLMDSYKYLE